jgi:glucose/mannose-6-phosphate isomerase
MTIAADVAKRIDPDDMYGKIVAFPKQLREGFSLPTKGDLSPLKDAKFSNIVVAGMGGSAIGGDILRSYLAEEISVPVYINRNYGLPAFVSKDTLMIASSYSGNTEETLSAFETAKARGCKIFVATTGGKLGEHAKADKLPHVILPAGLQPRAALGYSFGPLLSLMAELGFCADQSQIVDQACRFLEERLANFTIEKNEDTNPTKQLAQKLKNKLGVVYAGADFYDTVAVRFKGQICENAKHQAFANVCPEFNHNEIVGYEHPQELIKKLHAIFLTGPGDSKGVTNRFKIINEILGERGVETTFVKAEGPNRLAEIFSLVQFGDFTSYYLSLLNETDPSPVRVINRLKSSLEKMK